MRDMLETLATQIPDIAQNIAMEAWTDKASATINAMLEARKRNKPVAEGIIHDHTKTEDYLNSMYNLELSTKFYSKQRYLRPYRDTPQWCKRTKYKMP